MEVCMRKWTTGFLFAATIGAAVPHPVSADPIVVGAPANGASCIPFGCSDGVRYQQVFAADVFGGVYTISGIAFPRTIDPISGQIDPAIYEITLSTTQRQVGQLSADFNSNVGADETLVFAGPLAGAVSLGGALSFTLPMPFTFEPTAGNLLLDVVKQGGTFFGDDGVYLDYATNMNGQSSSIRLQISSGLIVNGNQGLVTVFSGQGEGPAPVPEPTTMLLVGTGITAGWLRRRRRADH
jgi:hypothetical protein